MMFLECMKGICVLHSVEESNSEREFLLSLTLEEVTVTYPNDIISFILIMQVQQQAQYGRS